MVVTIRVPPCPLWLTEPAKASYLITPVSGLEALA